MSAVPISDISGTGALFVPSTFGIYTLAAPSVVGRRIGDVMASPVAAAQDDDPYADRRAYPRVPVALPAFLQADGVRHSVHLLDLSPGGAKVNCQASLPTGTAVTLDCGTLGRAAVVRWNSGGVMGLCFDSELDTRDVLDLIARSRGLEARMKSSRPE